MTNLSGEFMVQQQNGSSVTSHSSHHSHKNFPTIRHKNVNFLTSLCIDPKDVSVVGQDADEEIHILVRRHHITNLGWILLVLALSALPFFSRFLFEIFPFLDASVSTRVGFTTLYYLALFGYTVLKFAEWYFHVGLITNKRLIDIDMHNILSKNVAETQIVSVEDVAYIQKGIIQSLLNYGTVNIQTEAVQANFEFDRIPHPSQVSELISEISAHAKKEGGE